MADIKDSIVKIDASDIYYRELNARLREIASNSVRKIELHNVYGQRYVGTDLDEPVELEIFGTPGNDLGAFMNGQKIIVHGNVQDGCGMRSHPRCLRRTPFRTVTHGRRNSYPGPGSRAGLNPWWHQACGILDRARRRQRPLGAH